MPKGARSVVNEEGVVYPVTNQMAETDFEDINITKNAVGNTLLKDPAKTNALYHEIYLVIGNVIKTAYEAEKTKSANVRFIDYKIN